MSEPALLPRKALGRTGLESSLLALSARSMTAAGPKGLKLAPEDVERAFHEHGVNTFLVSPGMKELVEGLRRLIAAGHRDELVLMDGAMLPFGATLGGSVRRACEALGTDYLDIFLLGMVVFRWYMTGRTWKTLMKMKEQGLIRAAGYSSHKRKLAAALAKEFDPDVIMVRYSAAHRGAESEVFDALGERRPAVISYTSTRWGVLLQPLPQRGFDCAMTAGECYRFVLAHPAVDIALFAARTPDELREDVAAVLEGPLSRERYEEVRRFGDAVHESVSGSAKWAFR